MKFKQIACIFFVLHVSHLMVMSRSLDEQAMGTDKSGVGEEKKREMGKYLGDLMTGYLLATKDNKAARFKVAKGTCQLPRDFRRLLTEATTINRLVQDLLERLLTASYLKGL